jgi:hypothetical protein
MQVESKVDSSYIKLIIVIRVCKQFFLSHMIGFISMEFMLLVLVPCE